MHPFVRARVHQAITIWGSLLVAIAAGVVFFLAISYAGVAKNPATAISAFFSLLILVGMRGEFYGRPSGWFAGSGVGQPSRAELTLVNLLRFAGRVILRFAPQRSLASLARQFQGHEDVLRALEIENILAYTYPRAAREALIIRVHDEVSLRALVSQQLREYDANIIGLSRVLQHQTRPDFLVVTIFNSDPPPAILSAVRARFLAAFIPEELAEELVARAAYAVPATRFA